MELALRLIAFRHVPYKAGLDVHEYLDKAVVELATRENFDLEHEKNVFERTFFVIRAALGSDAFKRWGGNAFKGKFLMSVFEVIATGVSNNIATIETLEANGRNKFLMTKAQCLWSDETFKANSGAGVRGTTRLVNLLPMANDFLRP